LVATSVCLPSAVCLSCVRSRKLHKIRTKFLHPYKESASESKNMTSNFASEIAKYSQTPRKPSNSPKWGSRLLSEIDAKFRCPYRKSGSPSKNTTSHFVLELAKYPKSSPKPRIAQNGYLKNDARYARNFVALIGNRGCRARI